LTFGIFVVWTFESNDVHRRLLVHCNICLLFGQSLPYTAFKSEMPSEK
jgi:hypothetical protein